MIFNGRPYDHCQLCHGLHGGTPGNEIRQPLSKELTIVICDYCHVILQNWAMQTMLDVDEVHGVAYVYTDPRARDRGLAVRSEPISEDIVADYDAVGRVIGIEFKRFPPHRSAPDDDHADR